MSGANQKKKRRALEGEKNIIGTLTIENTIVKNFYDWILMDIARDACCNGDSFNAALNNLIFRDNTFENNKGSISIRGKLAEPIT